MDGRLTHHGGITRCVETLPASRPDHSLIQARDGAEPFIYELLYSLPLVRLRRIDVALRVGCDAVHGEELTRLASAITEHRQNLERLTIHHVYTLVSAVREVEVLLLRIA